MWTSTVGYKPARGNWLTSCARIGTRCTIGRYGQYSAHPAHSRTCMAMRQSIATGLSIPHLTLTERQDPRTIPRAGVLLTASSTRRAAHASGLEIVFANTSCGSCCPCLRRDMGAWWGDIVVPCGGFRVHATGGVIPLRPRQGRNRNRGGVFHSNAGICAHSPTWSTA